MKKLFLIDFSVGRPGTLSAQTAPQGACNRFNRCRGHQGTQKSCQRPRQRFCLYDIKDILSYNMTAISYNYYVILYKLIYKHLHSIKQVYTFAADLKIKGEPSEAQEKAQSLLFSFQRGMPPSLSLEAN
ncbi:MAG: hypothetical protein IKZ52_09575 [Bacteroidales bacterium]|nr:hypothetical protein [Bacteroidales bacterium]